MPLKPKRQHEAVFLIIPSEDEWVKGEGIFGMALMKTEQLRQGNGVW